jgi:hypothetical protein
VDCGTEMAAEYVWLFNGDQSIDMMFDMDFAHFIVKIQNERRLGEVK